MSAARDEYNELFRDKSHRTQHPEDDNDDSASFLEDDSDTENNDPATPTAKNFSDSQSFATTATAKNAPRYQIPTRRHQSNTGPKGVITDAQDYANAAREYRTSVSANRPSLQQSRSNSGNSAPQIPASVLETGEDDGFGGLGETNGNDDEHDQDFMEQWRQNRLKELQGSGAAKLIGLSGREKRAKASRFGGLVPVDGDGFLEAVDGSGSVTVVVVFIYDDKSEVSQMVEDCLVPLARKYINTRFVKLHYQDAEMEPAGVPAVLAYRGGDKFAGLVPVVDEIPDDADLSSRTLEKVFSRHQIL